MRTGLLYMILLAILGMLNFASCNETLPVKEDISSQVKMSISAGSIRMNGENYIRLYVTMKNNLDETIDETAVINGSLQVTWIPNDPNKVPKRNLTRTIALDRTNIFRAPGYNASTGKLVLTPGDSIVLFVNWNVKTDDSTDISVYMSYFIDTQCQVRRYDNLLRPRQISEKQYFVVSASVKLFDRLAVLYANNVTVQRCYVARYLIEANPDPQYPCRQINLLEPCEMIGK